MLSFSILKNSHTTWIVSSVGIFLFVLGCGYHAPTRADRAVLNGSITYQGKPLPGGSVFAVSIENPMRGCNGMIDNDGCFSVPDVPLGPVKITVETKSMQIGDPSRFVAIPAKYTSDATSGLTADVKAGEITTVELKLD